jgi:hypothetical protein
MDYKKIYGLPQNFYYKKLRILAMTGKTKHSKNNNANTVKKSLLAKSEQTNNKQAVG